MQIGRKMTEFEAFEVLSVVLEHPVHICIVSFHKKFRSLSCLEDLAPEICKIGKKVQ